MNDSPKLRVTNRMPIPQQLGRWNLPPDTPVEVPMEFVELFGGAKGVEVDFSAVGEMLRSHDDEGHPIFDFWSPLSAVDGYGRHALAILRGLKELGAKPILRDAEWNDNLHLPSSIIQEAKANANRMPSRVGVAMSVPYDRHLVEHSSIHKIAITQFETDRVPSYHVRQVNRIDHLIVTSTFQPEIWRRSGLQKHIPISVLTPGIDTDFFEYRDRPPGDYYRVLMLGALTARKDPVTAIKAFQEASNSDPSWRLTIKTRRADGILLLLDALGVRHAPDQLPDYPWRGRAPVDPRIEVIISDDTPDQVRQWYWSHDCFLWPSKAEGVGLPALEAMATGMEVVMSNNSGMADYAYPGHCWPVGTSHMESAAVPGGFSMKYIETYGDVGNWWVPDFNQLVKQLKKSHAAWQKGRGKGRRAAEYVREHHTLAHQARSVFEVIDKYL
jgi:glycosyltransferase involved in cell wall biosynthesis